MKFSTYVVGLIFALSVGCTGKPVSTHTLFLQKQTLTGKVLLKSEAFATAWSYWQSDPDEVVVMPSEEGRYMAGSTMRSTYHYLGVCTSDRFILALYSGKRRDSPII